MKRAICRFFRISWFELEMAGVLPARIGRYLVVDILQQWEDRLALRTQQKIPPEIHNIVRR
jgi:hypothetical protein